MELKEEWILPDAVYDNPLLKRTLLGLKYYGLLLGHSQPYKKAHCFRGMVFTVSMVLFNCTQYIDLWQVWGSVSDMTANAATTLLFTTTIFRIIFFYFHRARFNSIIQAAHVGIERILGDGWDDEKDIVTSNVRYLNRLAVVFWCCALVTANMMCVYSLVLYLMYEEPTVNLDGLISNDTIPQQQYPTSILRSWYPAADGKDKHFLEIYLIQLYIMYVGQLIVPSWHMFMVTLMIYGRTECSVLNYRLCFLDLYHAPGPADKPKASVPEHVDNDERRSLIIDCIKRQTNLVAFTRELEQLTRAAVFLDFVVFSVLLCALLFEASMTTSGVQVFIDICYITTMTAILFLYYWHANEIHACADQLSMSAYKSDWYRYDHGTNRMLQIFILYSNRPVKMQAFFISMSLDTFLAILRASYSYFTILKQLTD
ncbi:odorant receptor 56a-like isoform X2 [Anopheles funestus]|uniref:odorant receptor 56a-like isoform X2 n=1 Tax=Anopheles funestus TaxID=62324 RepID=UPI0020C61CF6|nr:odorant receptor 56a-like isoform X2 [Anopheles funestus]